MAELAAAGVDVAIHPRAERDRRPDPVSRGRRRTRPTTAAAAHALLARAGPGRPRARACSAPAFLGKASPVHFFWGSFDLAVTRFSGRPAPPHPGGIPGLPDAVTREAYSHEVSSAGFWPGNDAFREAAFYSYAYPAPAGFAHGARSSPRARVWSSEMGEWLLPYEAVRGAADPDAVAAALPRVDLPRRRRPGALGSGARLQHRRPGAAARRSAESSSTTMAASTDGDDEDLVRLRQALEARTLELELERTARAESERVGRLKDEFLATLAHELRTPLSAILGWAKVLLLKRDDPAAFARGLEAIARNAKTQARLIDDVVEMNRIASGKARLDLQAADLGAVVTAAIDSIRPAADAKGLALQVAVDAGVAGVWGDPRRLEQVVGKLLANAVKFTPRGGRIDVALERAESGVEVTVRDDGIGIDALALPQVFDRFREADLSPRHSPGGLGLGLAIARQLTELHGGTLHARSEGTGRGATFVLWLPASASGAGAGAAAPALGAQQHDLDRRKAIGIRRARPRPHAPRPPLAAMPARPPRSTAPRPLARFRLRVTAGDAIFVGPGKIALLEAIRDTRSITAAAKSLGMSYRRAWVLVDELNRSLASVAVASAIGGEHGGGSALTALGLELVEVYRRIEATAARACAADIGRLLELATPAKATRRPPAKRAARSR